jgi:hypothetical protein
VPTAREEHSSEKKNTKKRVSLSPNKTNDKKIERIERVERG